MSLLTAILFFSYVLAPAALIAGRYAGRLSRWLLLPLPVALFVLVALQFPAISDGATLVVRHAWVARLGVELLLVLDGLSLLFALLVTLTTACSLMAMGGAAAQPVGVRFFALLFSMASMLGVVLAGNVLTLAMFWALVVPGCAALLYSSEQPQARRTGQIMLFVTLGGTLVMVSGMVLLALAVQQVVGAEEPSYSVAALRTVVEGLRASWLVMVALLLVLAGVLTASALVPLQSWLINASAAPAPARAFVHAAGLPQAGIYLLVRFAPLVAQVWSVQVVLMCFGAVTLLLAALAALLQQRMQHVVAACSLSFSGLLVLLVGSGGAAAPAALVVGVLVHALAACALMLLVGVAGMRAGSDAIDQVGGLRRVLPVTLVLTIVAALSLAGAPFLLGMVARRMAFAALLEAALPLPLRYTLLAVALLGMALSVAALGRLVWRLFFGTYRVAAGAESRTVPGSMLVAPALLLVVLLVGGLPLVGLPTLGALLTPAAAVVAGSPAASVAPALLGDTLPLLAIGLAVVLGSVLVPVERPLVALLAPLSSRLSVEAGVGALARGGQVAAHALTALLQQRNVRTYLATTLMVWLGVIGPVFFVQGWPLLTLPPFALLFADVRLYEYLIILPVPFAVLVAVLARAHFDAMVAVGVVGLVLLLLFTLFSAPELAIALALMQVLIFALAVPVVAVSPHQYRHHITVGIRLRDAMIALGSGVLMTGLTLVAATSRAFPIISPYYVQQSFPRRISDNIINALLVNFRSLDTLALAAGLFAVLVSLYAMWGVGKYPLPDLSQRTVMYDSLLFRTIARIMVVPMAVLGLALMLRGVVAPGNGFAGGLLAASALIAYLMTVNPQPQQPLFRISYLVVATTGLLLMLLSGTMALLVGLPFMTVLVQELPLVERISTRLLLELGAGLLTSGVVVQAALLLLGARKEMQHTL